MKNIPSSLNSSSDRTPEQDVNAGFDWLDLAVLIFGMCFYILVARVWDPVYLIKSAAKACVFIALPLSTSLLYRHQTEWLLLKLNSIKSRIVFLRILLISALIILLLALISEPIASFFNVANIMAEVKSRTQSPRWMVFASLLYIPIVNASMEEIYFRGYILQRLRQRLGFKKAAVFSAIIFALYHLVTFRNWFEPLLLFLALSGLFLAGLLLAYITERYRSLLPTWLIHAMMNVAILTIAFPYL